MLIFTKLNTCNRNDGISAFDDNLECLFIKL